MEIQFYTYVITRKQPHYVVNFIMKLNISLGWLWLLFGNNKPLEKALLLHKRGLITELVVGLQHKKSTFGLSFQEKNCGLLKLMYD